MVSKLGLRGDPGYTACSIDLPVPGFYFIFFVLQALSGRSVLEVLIYFVSLIGE